MHTCIKEIQSEKIIRARYRCSKYHFQKSQFTAALFNFKRKYSKTSYLESLSQGKISGSIFNKQLLVDLQEKFKNKNNMISIRNFRTYQMQ